MLGRPWPAGVADVARYASNSPELRQLRPLSVNKAEVGADPAAGLLCYSDILWRLDESWLAGQGCNRWECSAAGPAPEPQDARDDGSALSAVAK